MDIRPGSGAREAFRLRGRQAEVARLTGQLETVQEGRGGIALVSGLAGMGKSVLLDAAADAARRKGIRVFRGAADAAAQVVPLGPLFEALLSADDPPADAAVLRDLSRSPDQRFWLLREIQEALERVALRGPALFVVDDVQWADAATLVALGALPRQLATHPILWLLAIRSGEWAEPVRAAMSRLEAAGALRVTLGPLDQAAVADVAADLLGAMPDPALRKVLDGVKGQPFLLAELLRGLHDEKLVVVDGGTARLTGAHLPLRFLDSVNDHLARLSDSARDVLQMASVLGRRFSADELAALTGAAPGTVLAALRETLATGLITEDGDRVAFRHDLVREAVDATLPATVRLSLRRRAVDVMLSHGAPPSDVAELVMAVAQPGDTAAVTTLRKAAAQTGRVSSMVAGQLSRRALDLMPPGDPGRGALVVETTGYLVQAGQAAEAVRLITASAGDLADPAAEAETRLSLAVILMQYAPADVVEQCRRALDLPGVPAALRVQLLSVLSFGLDMLGDAAAAAGPAAAAAETARASGDPADEVITLVPRAVNALAVGDWRAAITLVSEAAARRHTVTGVALRLAHPEASKALTLIAVGRLAEAFALADSGMQAAQRDGIAANVRLWTMVRCRALYSAGRLADARAEAEAAIEMADEIGDGTYGYVNHMGLYILARVALHTGDAAGLAQARASAARLGRAPGCPASQRLGAWLTALVAHADGDAAAASGAEIDLLGDGPLPGSSPRMYADSATVTRILLHAGRAEDARSVVGRLEAFVAAHPDYPGAESAALHARAVLDGDAETALRAADRDEGDPRPLVRAEMLEDAGRLLPAARAKEAVQVLTRALEAYAAAGAERDAARVRVLIRARGARPRVEGPRSAPEWPELTESEFAVAGLVAGGATNREVADRLYLSHHTVNSHLRHVFAKLGIRSRVELARLMAERGTAAGRD